MRKFVLTLFAMCSVLQLSASPQLCEKIIYNGKSYKIDVSAYPLTPYFEIKEHRDTLEAAKMGQLKYIDGDWCRSGVVSTALNRGYIGIFEIICRKLMVKDIEVLDPDKRGFAMKSVMSRIFPNEKQVHVDWYTGVLALQDGYRVKDIMYAWTLYSHYIMLKIENGKLVRKYRLTGDQYMEYWESPFWDDQQIDEFYRTLKKKKNK